MTRRLCLCHCVQSVVLSLFSIFPFFRFCWWLLALLLVDLLFVGVRDGWEFLWRGIRAWDANVFFLFIKSFVKLLLKVFCKILLYSYFETESYWNILNLFCKYICIYMHMIRLRKRDYNSKLINRITRELYQKKPNDKTHESNI